MLLVLIRVFAFSHSIVLDSQVESVYNRTNKRNISDTVVTETTGDGRTIYSALLTDVVLPDQCGSSQLVHGATPHSQQLFAMLACQQYQEVCLNRKVFYLR